MLGNLGGPEENLVGFSSLMIDSITIRLNADLEKILGIALSNSMLQYTIYVSLICIGSTPINNLSDFGQDYDAANMSPFLSWNDPVSNFQTQACYRYRSYNGLQEEPGGDH